MATFEKIRSEDMKIGETYYDSTKENWQTPFRLDIVIEKTELIPITQMYFTLLETEVWTPYQSLLIGGYYILPMGRFSFFKKLETKNS